jgi:hypothetical protein
MKKQILLLIAFSGLLSICNAQRVQGTIRNSNVAINNQVIVSIKPSAPFNALISNLIVSVQIPTSVGPRPTVTFTNLQPNLFATWTQLDQDQGDGFYTWGFNCVSPGAGNTDVTAWAAAEMDVLQINFIGAPGTPFTARLDHYLDGGSAGFAIFYVETNLVAVNGGVLSDWGNLFYGTGASNGATAPGGIGVPNAGYSFVTAPNVVLPVKFVGFNVIKKNNDGLLTWQIENESSTTDRYEVERSLNGVDFKRVYSVAAKNNGKSSNSYDLTDLNLPALRSAGIFYYRIKQVDKDGKFLYTGVKNLRFTTKSMVVAIYPNPIKNFANLTIDLVQDANATVTINDASGKQIQNIQMSLFKGANIKKINMGTLAAGSYILQVQTADQTETIPVVKTN